MCDRAKLVRLMSARCPLVCPAASGRGRRRNPRPRGAVRSAISRMRSSPARCRSVGARIALVRRRGPPLSDHRGDVGGKRHRGVTISSPGSSPSTSTARYSAELPELHITPRCLPNSAATALHGLHVAADPHRGRTTAKHGDDGLDLALIVDGAGVVDPAAGLGGLTCALSVSEGEDVRCGPLEVVDEPDSSITSSFPRHGQIVGRDERRCVAGQVHHRTDDLAGSATASSACRRDHVEVAVATLGRAWSISLMNGPGSRS